MVEKISATENSTVPTKPITAEIKINGSWFGGAHGRRSDGGEQKQKNQIPRAHGDRLGFGKKANRQSV